MSPIFVRPVREQLEHDRLIRFLQAKYKRKLEAAINVGDERVVPVQIGAGTFFPDLVLMDGKKLAGLVEVETGESVNNLEALAQWVHFSKARVPFHLYVPVPGYDAARRLCAANGARPSEIWTYRPTHDGFDLVRIHHDAAAVAAAGKGLPMAKAVPVATATPVAKAVPVAKVTPVVKAAPAPKEAKPVKPTAKPAPAPKAKSAKSAKPATSAKKPAKTAKTKKKK